MSRLICIFLFATLAQSCPDSLVNVTRCNPVDEIVGLSAPTCIDDPTFRINKALTWAFECQLPIEVRIGLTMSLTGNRSDETYNRNVLAVLKEWSSQISTKSVDAIKLSNQIIGEIKMCPRFCVMDDESSEQKMVELYRSFAGDGNSTPPSKVWLSPSTYSFRNAAAQVANEYQKPMLMWSIPDLLRSFPIDVQLMQKSEMAAAVETLSSNSTSPIKDQIAAAGMLSTGGTGFLYPQP